VLERHRGLDAITQQLVKAPYPRVSHPPLTSPF
jgi:hypothetical protein